MEINHLSERASEDYFLVQKALYENCQNSYTKLLERYRDSVYHTMLKMVKDNDDAEDLTSEAFGKAFRRLESYSPSFAFSTWLFKIATNNCIDFIRKQKMVILSIDEGNDQNSMDTAPSIQIKNDDLDPEEKIMLAQRSAQLKKILEQLNDKYRQMLEYRYFDELSYQEIAEKLDIPLGTVKAQIFRAKELLYEILKSNKSL